MGVNGETDDTSSSIDKCGKRFVKPPMFQKGVLRTNCIDCLDRTNVAQFAFGLVCLGHQLHALGFTDDPIIGMDCPLADDLMRLYETMGDTLALQYGGSAAHNKSKIKLLVNSGKKKSGLSAEKPFLLAYEEAYCQVSTSLAANSASTSSAATTSLVSAHEEILAVKSVKFK